MRMAGPSGKLDFDVGLQPDLKLMAPERNSGCNCLGDKHARD